MAARSGGMVNGFPSVDTDHVPVEEAAGGIPRLRSDLVVSPRASGGATCYLIEDPLRARFYEVGPAEFALLSRFDGSTTVAEAIAAAALPLGAEALDGPQAMQLVDWLYETHLLESAGGDPAETFDSERAGSRGEAAAWKRLLALRLPLVHPDRALESLLPRMRWLFGTGFFAVWCLVCTAGLLTAWADWDHLTHLASTVFGGGRAWLLLVAWAGLKFVHETAHALACKHYGGDVSRAGVMFLIGVPVAFVDVTTAWRFPSKWARIVTAAAGIYVECFLAAVAIFVCRYAAEPGVQHLAYSIAVMACIGTVLFNANPLMRFDGYFILSDWLEIPNLYARSQQAVAYRIRRHLLGAEISPPRLPGRLARWITLYGIAALAWRIMVYAALCLGLVAALDGLGMLLACVLVLVGLIIPAVATVRSWGPLEPTGWRQQKRLIAASACAALVFALACLLPARVTAPAIVDYAPLAVVRTGGPGFVSEVLVAAGDEVVADQVIARLVNEELTAEVEAMRLAAEQTRIRARALAHSGEQAKHQVATAELAAVEKKLAELRTRHASLVVRAPCSGRAQGRQLATLAGRYLEEGAEICIVGREASKELVVAVTEDDVQLFSGRIGKTVRVELDGAPGPALACVLSSIEPRASRRMPHPALSALAGGEIPVPASAAAQGAEDAESSAPLFKASVALPADIALRLRAGERATLELTGHGQSWTARLIAAARRWIAARTGRAV